MGHNKIGPLAAGATSTDGSIDVDDDDPTSLYSIRAPAPRPRGSASAQVMTKGPDLVRVRPVRFAKTKTGAPASVPNPQPKPVRITKPFPEPEIEHLAFEPTVRQPLATATVIDVRWEDLDTSLDVRFAGVTRPLPIRPGVPANTKSPPTRASTRGDQRVPSVAPPTRPMVVIAPSVVVPVGGKPSQRPSASGQGHGPRSTLVAIPKSSPKAKPRNAVGAEDCVPPPALDRHLTSIFSQGTNDTAWEIPSLIIDPPEPSKPRFRVVTLDLAVRRSTPTDVIIPVPVVPSLARVLTVRAGRLALLAAMLFGTCIVVLRGIDAVGTLPTDSPWANGVHAAARRVDEASRIVWNRIAPEQRTQHRPKRR